MCVKHNTRRQNLGPAFLGSHNQAKICALGGGDGYRSLLPQGLQRDEREAGGGVASAACQKPQIPNTGLIS